MLSKLFYLVALVLFIVAVLVTPEPSWHPLGWAFVSLAAGLLVEGFGPIVPDRRSDQP